MVAELTNHSFWFYWLVFFGVILTRYVLIAGGAYVLFYSLLKRFFAQKGLRRKQPSWQLIRKDIELSVLSAVIFALCAAVVIAAYGFDITLLYTDPHKYGWWYLGMSFVAVLFLQDAYFYFIHRICHRPFLFKWLHHGHHRSGEPTPWTSFAFDPPEALLQGLFFVGIVFVLPLHFVSLVAALITMTIWAVWNHLGFELFLPRSLATGLVGG